jgi:glycosyltransferase involved in cell wall biosynthesis
MLRDKGVEEYVAAARLVKKEMPQARFLLVGDTDPNPAAISERKLDQWNREGVVEYHPAIADIRPLLANCTVYVLPSYHEGLPRSVLEAMAVGRPIITTDTIGCRETIFEAMPSESLGQGIKRGLNGFLVPVRGVEPLAAVMKQLANDRPMAVAMGQESRAIAEKFFDARLINDLMLKAMNLAPAGSLTHSS